MRHVTNKNLYLSSESSWQGLPLLNNHIFIVNYLERINQVIAKALATHPRTFVVRCDLRFPSYGVEPDSASISRFMNSLKAQIKADQLRKDKSGKRVHHSELNYVWVKERRASEQSHYHVCLFFNHDAYFTLGQFKPIIRYDHDVDNPFVIMAQVSDCQNMVDRIRKAWASALGMSQIDTSGLVHFSDNPTYSLDINSVAFSQNYHLLFKRLSYFAKVETKQYGDSSNCFGCSRT